MKVLPVIALLVAAPLTHSVADTAIEGRVELPKSRHAPVASKRYEIVSKGGVLAPYPAFAVVYLEGEFPRPASLPVQQMVQKNLAFDTAMMPVRIGTKIEFPNLDDTPHNIFSFSPVKRFDLGRYTASERPIPSQTFDKPGLVTLRCDIHEHMRALVLVLDTPHFVKTDNDGHFRLGGLPPGSYRLKAWIDSKTTFERPVQVKAGTTLRVDFP
ncbi:MAG: carboxypeptidase regulatory-like domain-containing protein [Chthoniobacteraceae bacterium]